MGVKHFPSGSFTPDRWRDTLIHVFRARTYGADDLVSFRGSVHYSNFHAEGSALAFHVAVPIAFKKDDGRFCVFVMEQNIVEDQIRGSLCISHVPSAFPTETGSLEDALRLVEQRESELKAAAELSLAYPRTCYAALDDLHVVTARMIARSREKPTAEHIMAEIDGLRRASPYNFD